MMKYVVLSSVLLVTVKVTFGRVQCGGLADDPYSEDEWEPVYRIYSGDDWNSHDDYLSQERTKRHGDEDDSQFRSWKLDKWANYKIEKVKVEIYDDNDEVAEFEFIGSFQNATSFFNPKALRRSSYDDIPDALSKQMFRGDDFSFDGDDDSRHWTVSSRHVGDCLNDEGWFQVVDKPKSGRDKCVCGYENVDRFPAIMYSRNKRKTRWSDRRSVGYADMMQVSVSRRPYPARTAAPKTKTAPSRGRSPLPKPQVVPPQTAPAPPPKLLTAPRQGRRTLIKQGGQSQDPWFET